MKKKTILFLLPLLALPLGACNPETPSKVAVDLGRVYDSSATTHFEALTADELNTMVRNQESFMMLVYNPQDTCDCWHRFRSTLWEFQSRRDAMIYGLPYSEFSTLQNRYGIEYFTDTETFTIFNEGELAYQKYRDGIEDPWANDVTIFTEWVDERVQYSKLLEVNMTQLDRLYSSTMEFTVYFGRSSCGDCAYVEEAFLDNYMKTEAEANLYYFDFDPYRNEGIEEYDAYKEKYGLSTVTNPVFGYDYGYFPTFYHINPASSSVIAEKVDDAAVYLNDAIKSDAGTYYVSNTYYTFERQPNLNFLSVEEVEHEVLEDLIIPASDVLVGTNAISWSREAAAEYHNPLLKAFLDTYIGSQN